MSVAGIVVVSFVLADIVLALILATALVMGETLRVGAGVGRGQQLWEEEGDVWTTARLPSI